MGEFNVFSLYDLFERNMERKINMNVVYNIREYNLIPTKDEYNRVHGHPMKLTIIFNWK